MSLNQHCYRLFRNAFSILVINLLGYKLPPRLYAQGFYARVNGSLCYLTQRSLNSSPIHELGNWCLKGWTGA